MTEELALADKKINLDKEGYLKNLDDWNPAVAKALAEREKIILSDQHWEVICLLRNFYKERPQFVIPVMRNLNVL